MMDFKGERGAQASVVEAAERGDRGAMLAIAVYNGIVTVGGHVALKLGYLLDEVTQQLQAARREAARRAEAEKNASR